MVLNEARIDPKMLVIFVNLEVSYDPLKGGGPLLADAKWAFSSQI